MFSSAETTGAAKLSQAVNLSQQDREAAGAELGWVAVLAGFHTGLLFGIHNLWVTKIAFHHSPSLKFPGCCRLMHEKGFNFAPVTSAPAGRQVPQVCPAGTSLQTMLWKSDGGKKHF